ncbi:MAG: extracellular solute-binding protein [Firmicutes bacterium]|nr:extracellular solute-binding protein [Bacillota bacterium]
MKRIIVILLSVSMVLSMVACVKTVTPQITTSTQSTQSTQSSTSKEVDKASYKTIEGNPYVRIFDPPLTYTTILKTPVGYTLPEGQTEEDNLRSRLFTRYTGLVPKVLWTAAGEAFVQKLNMAIASGDIPDYFEAQYVQYDALVKAGLLADITDLYNNILDPGIKDCFESADNVDIKAVTKKGKIYGIPKTAAIEDSTPVLWVRKDWMEKLKMPEPKCISDIETMAQAFINNDPDGNGKNDTLGLVICPRYDSKGGGTGSISAIFTNYGATPGQWRVKDENNVIYGSLMPEAANALELLNKWYKNGIIPKDFGTWDEATLKQKVTSGEAGMFFAPWWIGWSYLKDTVVNNSKSRWVGYALPKESDQSFIGGAPNPAGYQIGVISKKVKNPEYFIYALNTLAYHMGQPYYRDDIKEASVVNNAYTPMTIVPVRADAGLETAKVALQYATGKITSDDVLRSTRWDPYYRLFVCDIVKKVVNRDNPYENLDDWATAVCYIEGKMAFVKSNAKFIRSDFCSITKTMEKKGTFLEKLEHEAYTKMIMGDTEGKTIKEYFDSFVKQYLSQGGQEITDEVKAEIQANK